jgi:sec-independent protein translocase protein TatA
MHRWRAIGPGWPVTPIGCAVSIAGYGLRGACHGVATQDFHDDRGFVCIIRLICRCGMGFTSTMATDMKLSVIRAKPQGLGGFQAIAVRTCRPIFTAGIISPESYHRKLFSGNFLPEPIGTGQSPKEHSMLNNIGLPGLLLIAVVVLVMFGKGKVSSLMGEVGKGITAFKKGVNDGTKEVEDAKVDAAKDVTPAEKDKV